MSIFERFLKKTKKEEMSNFTQKPSINPAVPLAQPTNTINKIDVSRNQAEIISISQQILSANSTSALENLYGKYSNYPHPQIKYNFGTSLLINQNKDIARKALLDGAYYGIKFPCPVYDTLFADSVGQCFYYLLSQFSIKDKQIGRKATELCYLYLSQCIKLFPREAQDSYRTRALLIRNPSLYSFTVFMLSGYANTKVPDGVYVLSDFYFASQATGSPFKNALDIAKEIHTKLDDAEIGEKCADDYSLRGLAEVGESMHRVIFNKIEASFKNNKLEISKNDLESAISLI
jgi:hypothetical protein